MAKKNNNKNRSNQQQNKREEEMVAVDVYMVPASQAEMYQTLREAVVEDAVEYWKEKYEIVERKTLDPDEGEAIVAYTQKGEQVVEFYLNPSNISQAQKARDKEQIDKFLIKFEKDLTNETSK